jgi:hypothetical protein
MYILLILLWLFKWLQLTTYTYIISGSKFDKCTQDYYILTKNDKK